MQQQRKQQILTGISLVVVVAMFFVPRIPQDPLYHAFADENTFLSIPNALNVISNFLFAWIGISGLLKLHSNQLTINSKLRAAYYLFFIGLTLVATGSGYYHWAPDNQTLVWDRLPMTLAFMSFFSILLSERVSERLGRSAFPFLIVAGVCSILYWHWSELVQSGDLRPYALVQFLPVLLTPLILLMFSSRHTRPNDLWWFLCWYLIAKLLEFFDSQIYEWLIVVSGHSLKHIAASIGCLVFLRHLQLRRLESQ